MSKRSKGRRFVPRVTGLECRQLLAIMAVAPGVADKVNGDLAGPGPSVGPDGVPDVHIHITGIDSNKPIAQVEITGNGIAPDGKNVTMNWAFGLNPRGYANAEITKRATVGSSDTAHLSLNPIDSAGNKLVSGTTLTATPYYRNGNGLDGASATFTFTAPSLTSSDYQATPVVPPSDPAFTNPTYPLIGVMRSQDAKGLSSIHLDGVPSGTMTWAFLSNEAGSFWKYGNVPTDISYASDALPMRYDLTLRDLSFGATRNEFGATLTLQAQFGSAPAVAIHVEGVASDPNAIYPLTQNGEAYFEYPPPNVSPVPQFSTFVTDPSVLNNVPDGKLVHIRIKAGAPIQNLRPILYRPMLIDADPGAGLVFDPANPVFGATVDWSNPATGVILVAANHVTLKGFTITLKSTGANWTTGTVSPSLFQVGEYFDSPQYEPNYPEGRKVFPGGGFRDVNITGMTLNVEALKPGSSFYAVDLLQTASHTSGQFSKNTVTGGSVSIHSGPWMVNDNIHLGPVKNQVCVDAFNMFDTHDSSIQGNKVSVAYPDLAYPNGASTEVHRLLSYGSTARGHANGFNNRIQGNTFGNGAGQLSATLSPDGNGAAEVIVSEGYTPIYEGVPAAVSAQGWILQLPDALVTQPRTGDMVSILKGGTPGTKNYYMIAQQISKFKYLMAKHLPAGMASNPQNYVISINAGYVNDVYSGNTIDLSSKGVAYDPKITSDPYATSANRGNVAFYLGSAQYGTRIVGNTLIGQSAINLQVGYTENPASHAGSVYAPIRTGLAPDQPNAWTHTPQLSVVIDNNTIKDSTAGDPVRIFLTHTYDPANLANSRKSNADRNYLDATFTNNRFTWVRSDYTPRIFVGEVGFYPGTDPFTGWTKANELNLRFSNNSGSGGSNKAATVAVASAMISQGLTYSAVNHPSANYYWMDLPSQPNATSFLNSPILAINAGGSEVSENGLTYSESGATTLPPLSIKGAPNFGRDDTAIIDRSGVTIAAPMAVYQSFAYTGVGQSSFTYTIGGLTVGKPYLVRLHFAEIINQITTDGGRVFNVLANGNLVLDHFSIFKEAGHARNRAVVRQFPVNPDASGYVTLTFQNIVQSATFSGIELFDRRATAGDYDGDGKADLATYDLATGYWSIQPSLAGASPYQVRFGNPNAGNPNPNHQDIPVPGDYDGDGLTDLAVYDPTTYLWHIDKQHGSGTSGSNAFFTQDFYTVQWGAPLGVPVPADYSGDGRDDVGIFFASGVAVGGVPQNWWIATRLTPNVGLGYDGASQYQIPFGTAGDIPIPADYQATGQANPAVYRRSPGSVASWIIDKAHGPGDTGTNLSTPIPYGNDAGVPVPADYTGDGAADIAVYFPIGANGDGVNQIWWVNPSLDLSPPANSQSNIISGFGAGGSTFGASDYVMAVPADYNGDGKDDIANFYVMPRNTFVWWWAPNAASNSVGTGAGAITFTYQSFVTNTSVNPRMPSHYRYRLFFPTS